MSRPQRAALLVVDDEDSVTRVVSRWLSAQGYQCGHCGDGREALEALRRRKFALVIADIMMPVMTGMELLERARDEFPQTAFIMLTAVDDRETATRAVELGAYGYIIKPCEENEVVINVANALRRRRLEIMRDNYEDRLEETVQERTLELRQAQEEIILRLMAAAEFRDTETGAHVRRMGMYAEAVGRAMGRTDQQSRLLRLAAPMHDLGKIGIPDAILLKPARLDDDEFETMKSHTTIGARMLKASGIELLDASSEIALCHHERWDGSGYPRGLSGPDIPESGRIVALCDVYDALVNDRVYRPAMSEQEALAIVTAGEGTHFDPDLLGLFMASLPQLRRIRTRVRDEPLPLRKPPQSDAPHQPPPDAPSCSTRPP